MPATGTAAAVENGDAASNEETQPFKKEAPPDPSVAVAGPSLPPQQQRGRRIAVDRSFSSHNRLGSVSENKAVLADQGVENRCGQVCRLHFYVYCQTKHGQSVRVVSDLNSDSAINIPSKTTELYTTPSEWPLWYNITPLIVPRGATHSYKYALYNGDKIERFEMIPLRIFVARPPALTREDQFGTTAEKLSDNLAYFQRRPGSTLGSSDSGSFGSSSSISGTGIFDDVLTSRNTSSALSGGMVRSLSTAAIKQTIGEAKAAKAAADKANEKQQRPPSFESYTPVGIKGLRSAKIKAGMQKIEQIAPALRSCGRSSGYDLAKIMQGASLVSVCFHLPVELKRLPGGKWKAQWNDSIIARSDKSTAEEVNAVWVGTVNASLTMDNYKITHADKILIRKVLEPMSCIPVFANQEMVDKAYLGYCKQTLWPAFHGVDLVDLANACWNSDACATNPELSWDASRVEGYWEAYVALNALFADEIAALGLDDPKKHPNGATLWIHDYHLMLLPKLIADAEVARHAMRLCSVGSIGSIGTKASTSDPKESTKGQRSTKVIFFLHIPLTTSSVFRNLRMGSELLEGIVSSDAVGFHAFGNARHFIAACKRSHGLKFESKAGGLLGMDFDNRTVTVVVRPVGLEVAKIDRKIMECGGGGHAADLRAKHPGRKLIAGLDTCQRLSGVALKLVGLERLLDEYPHWQGEVTLVQKCFRPRSRFADEERTSLEIQRMVKRINKKYPGSVDYEEIDACRLTSGKRFGLWLACDVMLNTSVQEGLNIDCFEFVHVKPSPGGVILTSEFGSTVAVLSGALTINPFDIDGWVALLDEALQMPAEERQFRKERDMDYVASRPSSLWVKQILNDVFSADGSSLSASPAQAATTANPAQVALPINGAVVGDIVAHQRLQPEVLKGAYEATSRRLFIFDYSGTLFENEDDEKSYKDDINPNHKGRNLPLHIAEMLRKLSGDENNSVYVVSGLTQEHLMHAFRDLPQVGLVARDGICYSLAGAVGFDAQVDDGQNHGVKRSESGNALFENGVVVPSTAADSLVSSDSSTSSASSASSASSGLETNSDLSTKKKKKKRKARPLPTDKLLRPQREPPLLFPRSISRGSLRTTSSTTSLLESTGKRPSFDRLSESSMDDITDPGVPKYDRHWYLPDFGVDWDMVHERVLPIFHFATGRTNGSSIQLHYPGLAWSYLRCDPEEGAMMANTVKKLLEETLKPFSSVEISHDRGALEVVPAQLNKGTFVRRALAITTDMHDGLLPDFVFCIGDDETDEQMFSAALKFVAEQCKRPPVSPLLFSFARTETAATSPAAASAINAYGGTGVSTVGKVGVLGNKDQSGSMIKAASSFNEDDEDLFFEGGDDEEKEEEKGKTKGPEAASATASVASFTSAGPTSAAVTSTTADDTLVDTRMISCTVGRKDSSIAGHFVRDVKEVEELLEALTHDLV